MAAMLAAASQAVAQQSYDVDPEIRIQQLENQLRQLTGQNEELQYRNRQLEDRLRQLGAAPRRPAGRRSTQCRGDSGAARSGFPAAAGPAGAL